MLTLEQLLGIGNESAGAFNAEDAPKSLLDEMMEEIGIESEIDAAFYEAEASAITAATSVAENVYVAMAEKECGIEGAAPLDVYRGFGLEGELVDTVGMEAISDVVKRRAYSGLAQLKSLINTCIAWLKRIFGLTTNTKKIFKSLGDKAKKIRKDIQKARANASKRIYAKGDNDHELEKELVRYFIGDNDAPNTNYNSTDLNALRTLVRDNTQHIGLDYVVAFYNASVIVINTYSDQVYASIDGSQGAGNVRLGATNPANNERVRRIDNRTQLVSGNRQTEIDGHILNPDHKDNIQEELKNWKDNARTVRGINLFTSISAALDFLYSQRAGRRDIAKEVDRGIKRLETARKNMENDYRNGDQNDTRRNAMMGINEILSDFIYFLNSTAMYMNMFIKHYVRIADELFTDAKWLIAKAL
nr:MAG TPA: hypothetical protein [Caudoviricetes sp.]